MADNSYEKYLNPSWVKEELFRIESRGNNQELIEFQNNVKIAKSLNESHDNIQVSDIKLGESTATLYRKYPRSAQGLLFVPGLNKNRFAFQTLAKRLATLGFTCISIDIPGHFSNRKQFFMGHVASDINLAIEYLRNQLGCQSVGVIAHSMGGLGTLFSMVGYSKEIEDEVYKIWNSMEKLMQERVELTIKVENDALKEKAKESHKMPIEREVTQSDFASKESSKIKEIEAIDHKIEQEYFMLKQIIYNKLQEHIRRRAYVNCFILLAPPRNPRGAIPGAFMLKALPSKLVNYTAKYGLHLPQILYSKFERNPLGYTKKEKADKSAEWYFLKAPDAKEFVKYFTSQKDARDFIKLIEDLSKFKAKDGQIEFFEYYINHFLKSPPKLFIYGTNDIFSQTFIKGFSAKLEHFYESTGNAKIIKGDYTHMMSKSKLNFIPGINKLRIGDMTSEIAKHEGLVKPIIEFLDYYMGSFSRANKDIKKEYDEAREVAYIESERKDAHMDDKKEFASLKKAIEQRYS